MAERLKIDVSGPQVYGRKPCDFKIWNLKKVLKAINQSDRLTDHAKELLRKEAGKYPEKALPYFWENREQILSNLIKRNSNDQEISSQDTREGDPQEDNEVRREVRSAYPEEQLPEL